MKKKDNLTAHSSDEYDNEVSKTIPYYLNLHFETINIIKAMDIIPKIWLDTGCGTGTFIEMAKKEFPKTNFYLTDPSINMLKQAEKKLSIYKKINIIKPTESSNLYKHIDKKFDVITAIQSHHYQKKEERFKSTENCYKLLKNKGVFITFENTRPLTKKGVEIGLKNWKNFQINHGRNRKKVYLNIKRFDNGYFPINIEEHIKLYRDIGFKTVELFWYSYMQSGYYCIK